MTESVEFQRAMDVANTSMAVCWSYQLGQRGQDLYDMGFRS